MKILVVGNGFDLAHKLPTSYYDFLNFMIFVKENRTPTDSRYEFSMETVKNIQCRLSAVYRREKIDTDSYNNVPIENGYRFFSVMLKNYLKIAPSTAYHISDIEKIIKQCFDCEEYIEYNIKLLKFCSFDNLWIKYFREKLNTNSMRGINWIDFEAEIGIVIQNLEQIIIRSQKQSTMENCSNALQYRDLESIYWIVNSGKTACINLSDKDKFIQQLEDDLDNLIDCLEIYMILIDKMCICGESRDLRGQEFDKVISFNYTDYYHNFYKRGKENRDFDFIHGKAGDHNLVLGIDETLKNENDISNELSCIKFKKYFQRIYKYTGIKYIDWLENADENSEIVIFGHSLDCTDGEILEKLITCERISKTTIYYYNDEAHAKQILNLVKILKKDELIKRTGKKNIVFKRQAQMLI